MSLRRYESRSRQPGRGPTPPSATWAAPAAPMVRLNAAGLTRLQRSVGNSTVSRLLQTPVVQRDPEPNPMWLAMSQAVFQDRVGGPAITRGGQMMWGGQLYPAISAALTVAVDAFPATEQARIRPLVGPLLNSIFDPSIDRSAQEKSLREELKKSASKSAAAGLQAVALNRAFADKDAGLVLWSTLQKQYRATRVLPTVAALAPYATVGRMIGLQLWENIACFLTADALAALFYDAAGFGAPLDKTKAIPPTTVSAGVTRNRASAPAGTAVLGDVVTW